MKRLLHRLTHPYCDETCAQVCDHDLAMKALGRLGSPEGVPGPSPHPASGRPLWSAESPRRYAPGLSEPGRSSPWRLRLVGGSPTNHHSAA